MPPKGSKKPNTRKRRYVEEPTDLAPSRRQPRPLLPGSPKPRRDVNGNITNAADLSEATLALAKGRPRVQPTIPSPEPTAHGPNLQQQLAIHARRAHVTRPHPARNIRSGPRTTFEGWDRSQRQAQDACAPASHVTAHSEAVYMQYAVPSPASHMNLVRPHQQYQQQQYQPQQQQQQHQQQHFGSAFPSAELARFPSESSQSTLGHGPSNAMGLQPSSDTFQEQALQPEDFQQAGLNLDTVQNVVPYENGGEAQLQSGFLDLQNLSLDPSLDMAPVDPSNGWSSLDQMASRPIFHQHPAPAPAPAYQNGDYNELTRQQPLPDPTLASYDAGWAWNAPGAPTYYASQQVHTQPAFQPGHNHVFLNGNCQHPLPAVFQTQHPVYTNGYQLQQQGQMYAQNFVNNFVQQQPQPTIYTPDYPQQQTAQLQVNYPVADFDPPTAHAGPSSQQPENPNNSTQHAQQQNAQLMR